VTAALALERVSRSFGPVEVLHEVDLALHAGEVTAVVGENGAGKSTAMKILAGFLAPTKGRVLLDGQPVQFDSARAAEDAGVAMIHQEFNLAEHLTVAENVFLGRERRRGWWLDQRAMRAETTALMERLETRVDPDARLDTLAVSAKQMVEIAKALKREARVLIMDEPTAVLTAREAEVLFRQIERLRADGVAVLFVSHKLDEVRRIADRVTVLRDGAVVASGPVSEFDEARLAREMVGRDLSRLFPEHAAPAGAETVLEVEGLTGPGVRDLSFALRRGEVLAFAGLVGAGRTEAMEALVGLRPATGTIRIGGRPVRIRRFRDALEAGLGYLTEDRKGKGLLLRHDLRSNLTLLALPRFVRRLIDRRAEEAALERAMADFDIRAPHRDMPAGHLSGGNQQKLLIAKTMLAEPAIVIADEPTRGVDIGVKTEIYAFLRRLAEEGRSVIMISSEMGEVVGLADRVVVMRAGRKTGELAGEAITEDAIIRLAMGLADEGARAA